MITNERSMIDTIFIAQIAWLDIYCGGGSMQPNLFVTTEIASQPQCWAQAISLSDSPGLPQVGERVAIIGCGTSWFMAQTYAARREACGQGETDAFTASEFPPQRAYDRVIAISRSGTTTEVRRALDWVRPGVPTTMLTAVPSPAIAATVADLIDLSFADEQSVVQTRFATSVVALLRAHLGENLDQALMDCQTALQTELPPAWIDAEQAVFLGMKWTVGLANEAALKCREASLSFTEAHQAMDYRHGPISLAEAGRLVWMFGRPPEGLAEQVQATGATWIASGLDPLADLVQAQRLAVARGLARGLDPDHPRHLSRAVVLEERSPCPSYIPPRS
ncbi:MAG: sugar isomerase [Propionibacteriaceae bacterium]|jgi:fructoselysine-6-P-deglycase FrlB-like protein|nr:sugar isomerase [Propionibacteriaceae bacterium]